jgi:hypothetical protein
MIRHPLSAPACSAILPLSSSGADAAGVAHVAATGLMGVVWAGGFTVVPVLAGAIAQSASTTIAYLIMAALSIPVLAILRRTAASPLPSDARAETG